MGEYDESRNINGLSCRWGVIQAAVNKFHRLYERLERHLPSGTTPDDMKKKTAMRMFIELGDGPFKFEHCWVLMKANPKWCSQQLTKIEASKKHKVDHGSSFDNPPLSVPTTPGLPFSVEVDSVDPDATVVENTNTDGVLRSQGRKESKEKRKRALGEKGVIDALSNLNFTLEK